MDGCARAGARRVWVDTALKARVTSLTLKSWGISRLLKALLFKYCS
jgi:hypothetical protein